jgi:phosphomannomutase / phosphoglucomutase
MLPIPRADLKPNTLDFERLPLVKPTGFREYDARWLFPQEINLMGLNAIGLGMAEVFDRRNVKKRIVVGHDFRWYSASVKQALMNGLIAGGFEVHDIGLAMSQMAYFAQFELNVEGVAMVTASHNDNGWTGIKMGLNKPLTFGPEEMSELKEIVLTGKSKAHPGGRYIFVPDLADRYIKSLTNRPKYKRHMKVIAACGNGTAGAFAPKILEALGLEVVPVDCELDHSFPNYNPNPEDMEMLHAMSAAVLKHKADVALGFDGDGDRCGIVDNEGHEIFADTVGVMLARDLSAVYPNSTFVADERSESALLENRPQLHEALHARAESARRLRKERPLLLPATAWSRLRRRSRCGDCCLRYARARSRQNRCRSQTRAAQDLAVADHVAALRRREKVRHRRKDRRGLRGRSQSRRQHLRPENPRSRHRQRCALHIG